MNITGLFEHDRTSAGVDRLHIIVSELRDLGQLPGFRLIAPDIFHAIAIRNEED